MQILPLKDITILENRIRREFKEHEIEDLAASIKRLGLAHPVVLQSDANILIAGERRLRAITKLSEAKQSFMCNGQTIEAGFIPCIRQHEMTDEELLDLELEENIRRVNLTVVERAQAIARLHKFREEKSKSVDSLFSDKPLKHSYKETAKQIAEMEGKVMNARDQANVARAILISKFANDPEVKAAPTFQIAEKIIKRKLMLGLGTLLQSEAKGGSPCNIIEGDLQNIMDDIPDGTYEGIIADPPYGIGAHTFTTSAHTSYSDTEEEALEIYEAIIEKGYRVCKPNAHLYLFHDILAFPTLRDMCQEVGWWVSKYPMIWHKLGAEGHVPDYQRTPRRSYEAILFAIKGERNLLVVKQDVLPYRFDSKHREHPAKKPIGLYVDLISRSFDKGDRVLDPCCGAGTIFEAAQETGIYATGIESNPEYTAFCKNLIAELYSEEE